MSDSPPTPPQGVPDDIVKTLNEQSPEVLRHTARYVKELATYREHEARLAEKDDSDEHIENRPDDHPEDVPPKASITVKEINENQYYY